MQIVAAIILLSFLIIIHELGHLWGARLFKVKVREFSIFMGPKLFSHKGKKTEYSLRAIPIGGFVALEGETETSDDKDALSNKPRWQQAVVMLSGSAMNLIFGLIAFLVLTLATGYIANELTDTKASVPDYNIYIQDESMKYGTGSPVDAAGIKDGDTIIEYDGRKVLYPIDILIYSLESRGRPVPIKYSRNGEIYETILEPVIIPEIEVYRMGVYFAVSDGAFDPVIEEVIAGSPAEKAGIIKGDIIVSIDDSLIENRDEVAASLAGGSGGTVKIKLLRNGKEIDLSLMPERSVQKEYYYNGLFFAEGSDRFVDRCKASFRYYGSVIKSVYYSLIWLIGGKVSIRDAMGPVGIVTTIGTVVSSGETISNIAKQLLSLLGLISINLGFINLVPFPALDGSKLVILGIEGVAGRKIPLEKQAVVSFIGFAILILLMIALTGFDIMRLFGK